MEMAALMFYSFFVEKNMIIKGQNGTNGYYTVKNSDLIFILFCEIVLAFEFKF